MKLVKYEKDDCGPCAFVKTFLDDTGVAYKIRNISRDPEAKARLKKEGFMGVPVVALVDDEDNFVEAVTGFNPPAIMGLIEKL